MRKRLDPANYNGASLVGLKGIVVKNHGSANIFAFSNALKEAVLEVKKIPERIQEQVMGLLKESDSTLGNIRRLPVPARIYQKKN